MVLNGLRSKLRSKGRSGSRSPPPVLSEIDTDYVPTASAEWRLACFRRVLDAFGRSSLPALAPGWEESAPDGAGSSSSSADLSFRHEEDPTLTTRLDPRFLPCPWRMRLQQNGEPVFLFPDAPPTEDDPRGAGASWRMLLDEEGQSFWANDEHEFTTYVDPRGLPEGYELRCGGLNNERPVFVNSETKETSWTDPRNYVDPAQLDAWRERDLEAYLQHHYADWAKGKLGPAGAGGGAPVDPENVLPDEMLEAAHRGSCAEVGAYLHSGGRIDALDGFMGATLLMAAASCGHVSLVELLLSSKPRPDVQLKDSWGCTALISACCPLELQPYRAKLALGAVSSATRVAVVHRLLAAKASVDEQDSLGLTALMVASVSGEAGTVKKLLAANADRQIVSAEGFTALEMAELHGQPTVHKLLRQKGGQKGGSSAGGAGAGKGGGKEKGGARGKAPEPVDPAEPVDDASGHARDCMAALLAEEDAEVAKKMAAAAAAPQGKSSFRRKKKGKKGGGAKAAVAQGALEAGPAAADPAAAAGPPAAAESTAGGSAAEVADEAAETAAAAGAGVEEAAAAMAAAIGAVQIDPAEEADAEVAAAAMAAEGEREEDVAAVRAGSVAESPCRPPSAPPLEEPDEELYCPISHTLLKEAVMTSTGHLFNETPLREWLRRHPGLDPLSNQTISDHLVPAFAVRAMAERWAEKGYD